MKILAVADTEDRYIWDFFDPERFSGIDLIVSCGDLKPAYLEFLVTMIPAPLVYIYGNHDTRYRDKPPQGCEDIDGDIYVHSSGLRILGLGGSMRYRPHVAHQYSECEMAKRIAKLRKKLRKYDGFDILITHAPAYNIGDGEDVTHRGFESFIQLIVSYSPMYMLHGHQHHCYDSRIPKQHIYNNTKIVNVGPYTIIEINT